MKNYWILLFIPLIWTACSNYSPLNKEYRDKYYKNDFIELLKMDELSDEERLLIDYAIVRQRDYFNYEVEGKSFNEILTLAKDFSQKGLPTQWQIDKNGEQDYLTIDIANEGTTYIRKSPNSSRLLKKLRFNCLYTNSTDKDLVLQNSSFLVKGPFQDHLTTIGYELNCLIKAGGSMQVNFIADAKNIRNNLLHDSHRPRVFFSMDSLLNNLIIESGGHSIVTKTEFYKECNHGNTRIAPFIAFDYKEDLEILNEGRPQTGAPVQLGNAHYIIEEEDQPINLFRTN